MYLGPDTTTSLIMPCEQGVTSSANNHQYPDLIKVETIDIAASLGLPKARQFIEDEGPEWRELDYHLDVGNPPSTFFLFFQQYDWSIYTGESLTNKVLGFH